MTSYAQRAVLGGGAALLSASLLLAQEVDPQLETREGPGEPRERSSSLKFEPFGGAVFDTDLDGAGEFGVVRFGGLLSYDVPILDRSSLGFGLRVERSEYDFSGATGLAPGGDPLGGATVYALSAQIVHPLNRDFLFIGGASVEWAGEDGADFGDAARLGGIATVSWRASEDLSLSFGAIASERFEDSVRVIPFLGVEWQFAENMRLSSVEAGRVLAGGQGGGLGVVYEADEDLSLVIGGAFSGREYRLDEDGPLPNGVLSDDRVVAGVGVAWDPSVSVSAQLAVGAAVWSNIETLDSTGSTVGDEDGDPAPFIAARVRILF